MDRPLVGTGLAGRPRAPGGLLPRPHRMPLASRDRRSVPPASGLPWSRVLRRVGSGQQCSARYVPRMSEFEGSFERNPKIAGGELVLLAVTRKGVNLGASRWA